MEDLTNITIGELKELSELELRCYHSLVCREIEHLINDGASILKKVEQLEVLETQVIKMSADKNRVVDITYNSGSDLSTIQMHHVLKVLKECDWSRSAAARKLGKKPLSISVPRCQQKSK